MIHSNPADCIYHLISQVRLVVTSELKKEFLEFGTDHIKPAYLGVLMSLWNQDGLKVVELGRRAGLEPSTMTGLLDRMERDKLLTRVSDPKDRRSLKIELTDKGKENKETVLTIIENVQKNIFNEISEEETDTVSRVLRKVLNNFGR